MPNPDSANDNANTVTVTDPNTNRIAHTDTNLATNTDARLPSVDDAIHQPGNYYRKFNSLRWRFPCRPKLLESV